jgi:hypothetical protein
LREAAKTPEEIKFANEQSQKFFDLLKEGKEDDVYTFLDTKRKLGGADKMSAQEAIRLQIEMANPHYKPEDVADVFEEKYSIPEKPEQTLDEDDDEFAARETKWKAQVEKISRRIERDAVEARTALAKLNQDLVLPDIPKKQQADPKQVEAQQKELERLDLARQTYLQSLDSDYNSFDGFKAVFKSEDAEIPVSFEVQGDEKVQMKEQLKNFDIEGFAMSRWFHQDGKPNVKQLMEDMYLLNNRDKIFQKLVNDSGQKVLVENKKKASNIDLNGGGNNGGNFVKEVSLGDLVWNAK